MIVIFILGCRIIGKHAILVLNTVTAICFVVVVSVVGI